jgi:ELWxxDGT repeat protein
MRGNDADSSARTSSRGPWLPLALVSLALAPAPAAGQLPERLTNVTTLGVHGQPPFELTPSPGGLVLFAGTDGQGNELWRTDLTPAGTLLVKDIRPGPDSSRPVNVTLVNGVWLFSADDETHGRELWRSDGSEAGTRLVEDIWPGAGSSSPGNDTRCNRWGLAQLDRVALFTADDGVHGAELWRSDGTESGTYLVKDVNPGPPSSGLCFGAEMVTVGTEVFFVANDGAHGAELWVTNGSSAGTRLVKDTNPYEAHPEGGPWGLTAAGGLLFFQVRNPLTGYPQLWRSDGTAAGTIPLGEIAPWNQVVSLGGRVFFGANPLGGAPQLWTADGTPAGTRMVSDLGGGGALIDLGVANGRLILFVARPLTELWTSDGSTAGTAFVASIQSPPPPPNPPGTFSPPNAITPAGSVLYFLFDDTLHGSEPWRTDGTVSGTAMVRDVREGLAGSWTPPPGPEMSRNRTIATGGDFLFSADDGKSGPALWWSDGTAAGTKLLRGWSMPMPMATAGGALYFVAGDGLHGAELWKTDGLPDGETMVADIRSGPDPSAPADLTPLEERLYFTADDGTSGRELWRSDGTEAGTVRVRDIRPGAGSSDPRELTVFDGRLYFTADDGTSGRELWRSDGTEAGTARVADIDPGPNSSSPYCLTVSGGALYFVARPPGYPAGELWRTDGAEAGTRRLTDLLHTWVTLAITEVIDVAGTVYFSTAGNLEGLWRSDGTSAGTYNLKASLAPGPSQLTAVNGRVFFTAAASPEPEARGDQELWVSDGTPAGTTLVLDILGGGLTSAPSVLTVVGDRLYFAADDGVHGRELWTSDGTAAGTSLVEDVRPGPDSSGPAALAAFRGTSFLAADDGVAGRELWTSDGTSAGTFAIADLQPGSAGSAPSVLTPGDALYLTADDGTHGRQVWRLPTGPTLVVAPTAMAEGDGGTVEAVFTVSLLQPPASAVSVDYSTADGSAAAGSDYESRSGTLVFDPGELAHTIVVPVVGDTLFEPDETFRVVLGNPVGASLGNASAEGRIKDDDGALVRVSIPGAPFGSDLRFSAHLRGGVLAAVTGPQSVDLSFAGKTAAWISEVAGSAGSWLRITPPAGTGPATLRLEIVDVGGFAAGTYTATVSFSGPTIVNTVSLGVTLTVSDASARGPFGFVDTPANAAGGIVGATPVTGWALDDVEIARVEVYRDPMPGEPTRPNGKVYVGDGTFVPGARPDVGQVYSAYPRSHRAGWGYMLLTNMLPGQGNGPFTLHAYAYDAEGNTTLLGSRAITCTNAAATKPFGTIDAPGQGETISGNGFRVWGWALTPQPAAIPSDGSTIWVYVDGVPLGHPAYGQHREDIATAFPGYANSDGAVGYWDLDTTALANGIHTIAWSVTDDQGRVDGIGSRYFWVQN